MNSPNTTPKSINIIGAGSMGHLWAAYLSKAGHQVNLYNRSKEQQQSILLKSEQHQFKLQVNYRTFGHWCQGDLILVAVKAHALESVCRQLALVQVKLPPIVLMMNGLGLIEIVNKNLPSAIVYQASTTHGALFIEESTESDDQFATILHTGQGQTFLGQFSPSDSAFDSIKPMLSTLNEAIPPTTWNEQHSQALWRKIVINSIINPLTAIHNVENGSLITDKAIHSQACQLAQELQPLIEHYLPGQNWQALLDDTLEVARKTKNNSSSMRQDINKGRKTEIDFISGYILNKAHKHGWSLAKHLEVVNHVKKLELQTHNSVTKRVLASD